MDITNNELMDIIKNKKKIAIFSGAGVSTESNISDYKYGEEFYSKIMDDFYEPRDILTTSMFQKNKPLFFEYFQHLTDALDNKKPNKSHLFAKYLYDEGKLLGVITQNIDGLYDTLLPENKISYIHGKYNEYICTKCKNKISLDDTHLSKKGNRLSNCHDFIVKPNVTLYGDNFSTDSLLKYNKFISESDCIIVMGTELDIIFHNKTIGNYKNTKILLNRNDVAIYKYYNSLYSNFEDKYLVDWDLKIIAELDTLFK